jgi:hypothetical protein
LQAQLGDKRQHRAIHDTPVHVNNSWMYASMLWATF